MYGERAWSTSADTHCMLAGEGRISIDNYSLNSKEHETRILTFDRLVLFVFNYPK